MKTIYKNTPIEFDVEKVDGKTLYYGSTWANPDALICEGGDTLESMCENLLLSVKTYNEGGYEF